MEKQILEILKNKLSLDLFERELSEQELLFCERLSKELSSLMSADLRKELIEFGNFLQDTYRLSKEYDITYMIDEYLKSRPDSKAVTDEIIDAFYPITSDTFALTWDFVKINKARREGAKAHRDGLITK